MRLKDYRKKAKELGGKLKVRSNSQKMGAGRCRPFRAA